MLASNIQAQSALHVPGCIAQIMSQASLGPVVGKYGLPDLDRRLEAAGVHYKRRIELKAWLHDHGLLVSGPR
jgi:hypothetical protein